MSAHTPGPWVLVHYAQGMDLPIPFMEHKTVAVFADGVKRGDVAYMQHGLYGDDQALANARLIAAAPELLGALRFILAFYEPGQTYLDTNAWKRAEASARAAITKATGGEA
jgi:hypothetical protein